MQVRIDDLRMQDDGAIYHWTLTGTNTGPNGTGRAVRISGFEVWQIGADGLIANSRGHFDSDEYRRQLESGPHREEDMSETFDFIVVGGGSAGAVIAARLSEDPGCRVALLEAGERPPDVEVMPVACAAMQLNPATDWMYTADPGKAGSTQRTRVPVPRGKMLGDPPSQLYGVCARPPATSTPGRGRRYRLSYTDVLPYFRKSEGLAPSDEIVIDEPAHNSDGPLGVSVRSPVLPGARAFVEAAEAAGIPRGDYNGRDRGGATGVVSLVQTNTRNGKRSSTYRAFLEGDVERRPNLTIITGAQATRVLLDGSPEKIEARASSIVKRPVRSAPPSRAKK